MSSRRGESHAPGAAQGQPPDRQPPRPAAPSPVPRWVRWRTHNPIKAYMTAVLNGKSPARAAKSVETGCKTSAVAGRAVEPRPAAGDRTPGPQPGGGVRRGGAPPPGTAARPRALRAAPQLTSAARRCPALGRCAALLGVCWSRDSLLSFRGLNIRLIQHSPEGGTWGRQLGAGTGSYR